MKLTVLPFGSWGDVQPFVALAHRAASRSHDVTVATTAAFRTYVEDCGLRFVPVPGDVRAAMRSTEVIVALDAGGKTLPFLAALEKTGSPFYDDILAAQWETCQGADLILSSPWSANAAHFFAQRLGVPVVLGAVYPLGETREFETILFDPAPRFAGPFRGLYNKFSHHVTRWLMWYGGRARLKRGLQRILPDLRIPLTEPLLTAERQGKLPVLLGYSEHALPRPTDWRPNRQVTGFWTLAHEPGWEPPEGLEAFLKAGPEPVVVGFGSMSSDDPSATAKLVVAALRQASKRGIIVESYRGLSGVDTSENVFSVGSIPYDWLFPLASAVVHHGGAGAVSAALRAGVPSIVVPSICDQRFWGRRLHALGVAPAPILRTELDVDRLAQAIRQAHQPASLARARELASRIAEQDGATRAVELLEEHQRALARHID